MKNKSTYTDKVLGGNNNYYISGAWGEPVSKLGIAHSQAYPI